MFDAHRMTECLELIVQLRQIRAVQKRSRRSQKTCGFKRRLLGKSMPDNPNRHC